jgi:hypothetical protein
MTARTTSKLTTDHAEIRRWAQDRNAKPATVANAEKGDSPSRLRLKLPGRNGGLSLKEIGWDAWLREFDQRKLAFLYQEQIASGERSDYYEIVSRQTADEVENAVGGKGRSASRRSSPRGAKPGTAGPRARAGAARGVAAKGSRTVRARSDPAGPASTGNRLAVQPLSAVVGRPESRSHTRRSRTTTRAGIKSVRREKAQVE